MKKTGIILALLLLVTATAEAVSDNVSGLVVQYDMDSLPSGTTVGDPSSVSGQEGSGAYAFDGNDGINLGNPSSLQLTDEITMAAWVRPTGQQQSGWGRIITRTNGGTSDLWAMVISSSDQLDCRVAGTRVTTGAGTISQNQWQHVACVYDGSEVRVYIDGDEVASRGLSGSLSTSNDVAIGYNPTGGATRHYIGEIDDLRIYNRGLSESEINDISVTSGGGNESSQPAACSAFDYSAWGSCQSDGTQTRSVQSSSPSGCTGGAPVVTQSCTYQEPTTPTTPLASDGNIIRTQADLGWSAGQDISDELANLVSSGQLGAGETLVFQDMYVYRHSSAINFPQGVTLAGERYGDGVDMQGRTLNTGVAWRLADDSTLYNLTVQHSDAPRTGYTGLNPDSADGGPHYIKGVTAINVNGDDVSIINSHLEGNVGALIQMTGQDRLVVKDSHIKGGWWTFYVVGPSKDAVFENNFFDHQLGDGLKTVRGSGPVEDYYFTGNVYIGGNRDAIDTTGGLKNSVIENNYMIDLFSPLDIKNSVQSVNDDVSVYDDWNDGVVVRGNEFRDNTTPPIVLTTMDMSNVNDRILTVTTMQDLRVKNMLIENNKFYGENGVVVLARGGDNINVRNNDFYGNITPHRNFTIQEAQRLSHLVGQTELNGSLLASNNTNHAYESYPGDAYFSSLAGPDTSLVYNGGGVDTSVPSVPNVPVSSDPTPDPTPDPDPTPTPATPVPDPEPVTEVVVDSPVNVREEPSVDAPIVGEQTPGGTGEVIEDIPEVEADGYTWVPVDFDNGADGWVVEQNVTKKRSSGGGSSKKASEDSSTTSSEVTTTESSVVSKNRLRTTSNLNVRATPGGSLVRMVTLGTAGEKLDVPAIQQGGHTWVKVRFDNGTEGYVAETYTQAETTSNSSGLTDSERRAKIADLRAQLLQLLVLLLELKSR